MSVASFLLFAVFPLHLLILNKMKFFSFASLQVLISQSFSRSVSTALICSKSVITFLAWLQLLATISVINIFCFKEGISLTSRLSTFNNKLSYFHYNKADKMVYLSGFSKKKKKEFCTYSSLPAPPQRNFTWNFNMENRKQQLS